MKKTITSFTLSQALSTEEEEEEEKETLETRERKIENSGNLREEFLLNFRCLVFLLRVRERI